MKSKKIIRFFKANKTLIIRAVLIALIIVVMSLIFGFSAQTGEESSDLSGTLMASLMKIVGMDPESLSAEEFEAAELVLRKLGHFTEYALLGALVCLLILTYSVKRWLAAVFATAFSFVYACLDELHQLLVPDRGARFTDVLIDTGGSLFGSALALGLVLLTLAALSRKKKKKSK